MPKNYTLITTSLLFVTQSVLADVIVTNVDEGGNETVVKLTSEWGKIIDKGDFSQYVVLNLQKNIFYVVDHQDKMVVQLSDMAGAPASKPHDNANAGVEGVEIKTIGDGPVVAGYKTTHYKLQAGEQFCSDHFISKEPLKIPEIKAFSDAMKKQAQPDMHLEFSESPCDAAEAFFDQKVFEYGVPLLEKNAQGKDTFKITEIKTDASLAKDEFKFPDGYSNVTQTELIQREMSRDLSSGSESNENSATPEMIDPEEIKKIQDQMKNQMQKMQQENSGK